MNQYQFEDLISEYVENKLTLSKRKEIEEYLKENPKAVIKVNQVRENILVLKIDKSKKGYGMEPYLEMISSFYFSKNVIAVKIQCS